MKSLNRYADASVLETISTLGLTPRADGASSTSRLLATIIAEHRRGGKASVALRDNHVRTNIVQFAPFHSCAPVLGALACLHDRSMRFAFRACEPRSSWLSVHGATPALLTHRSISLDE